jgi:hypothetical protein
MTRLPLPRRTIAWAAPTRAALPRYNPLRELVRELERGIDGTPKMGMARLFPDNDGFAARMGLSAAGGVGGLIAATQLEPAAEFVWGLRRQQDVRRQTTRERREHQRAQRHLRALRRALRDQEMRSLGAELGRAQGDSALLDDIRRMNEVDSPYWRENRGVR